MKTKKNISLEEAGNKLPFVVPDNYFEDFALNIEQQIARQHKPSAILFKPWFYIAAVFVGVLFAGQVYYALNKNTISKNTDKYESYVLSQVDESSIMDYYIENQGY
ncbi:MAG TPA: hypothetical protein VK152_03890 [Paludibacter sp.]|nr:hypothetical protein [Paludibacter sp.]